MVLCVLQSGLEIETVVSGSAENRFSVHFNETNQHWRLTKVQIIDESRKASLRPIVSRSHISTMGRTAPRGKWDELFSWLIDTATSYFTRREGKTYRKQKRWGIAPRLNYNHTRRLCVCVWVSVQCGGRKYGCCNSVCRRAFREGGIYISLRAVKVIRLVIGAVKNEWAIDALSPRRERRLKCSRRSAAHAHPLIRPILRRAALAKNSIRNFALNDERSPARGDPFCASLSLCFVVFALNWSTLCILSWAEMMRFRFTLSHTERE
jgi:hypothetical protein